MGSNPYALALALAVTRPSSACRHSPQAGRRDKRRRLNPAFTARPRERAGRGISLLPACGEKVAAAG
ncbi:hypothetical protein CN127_04320 [Sinorhizobium meliloti]|nr:hypothetical protein CN127_04320 [Sinorhizobium meliloti]